MDFHPKRNYVMPWNLNVQRQIAPDTTVMVGYVAARGKHMRFQADDVNMVYPVTGDVMPASGPLVWPVPNTAPASTSNLGFCADGVTPANPGPNTGCPWPVVNQFMGRTQMALWDGSYYYNGLQAQIRKKMGHGIEAEASYTYSKNMDDGGGSVASDPFRNSISTLLWFCEPCRRGLADQDQRHAFTFNYDWNIPTPARFNAFEKAILGGWENGSILTISSGTPFTVLLSGDNLGQNNTDPYSYPDRVNSPDCKNPINAGNANDYVKISCFTVPNPINRLGDAGRNSVIGPGLVNLDFSLFKNFPIREALKAQFRAEFFNIINHPNFQSPQRQPSHFRCFGESHSKCRCGHAHEHTTTGDSVCSEIYVVAGSVFF
jgi:hypothetical protein